MSLKEIRTRYRLYLPLLSSRSSIQIASTRCFCVHVGISKVHLSWEVPPGIGRPGLFFLEEVRRFLGRGWQLRQGRQCQYRESDHCHN